MTIEFGKEYYAVMMANCSCCIPGKKELVPGLIMITHDESKAIEVCGGSIFRTYEKIEFKNLEDSSFTIIAK